MKLKQLLCTFTDGRAGCTFKAKYDLHGLGRLDGRACGKHLTQQLDERLADHDVSVSFHIGQEAARDEPSGAVGTEGNDGQCSRRAR